MAKSYRIFTLIFFLLSILGCASPESDANETIIRDSPEPRTGSSIYFDPVSERSIVMGGFSCELRWQSDNRHYSDLWAFDSQELDWEHLGAFEGEIALNIGVDTESGVLILLTEKRVETWAFDLSTGALTNMEPEEMPPNIFRQNLYGAPMAYDSESDRLILFSGTGSPSTVYPGTWAYDYNTNTWTDMQPENPPPPRGFHATAYDVESDRVLVWGGVPKLNQTAPDETDVDMWAYDFNTNTWTRLENTDGPQTQYARFGMIYHPPSDRTILYAGYVESLKSGVAGITEPRTWSFDLNTNTWEEIITEVNPGTRMWYSMIYDPSTDQIILFGGEQTRKFPVDLTNAVWLFDFETMQWRDSGLPAEGCPE